MSSLAPLAPFKSVCQKCSACGLCLPVCPSFRITGKETQSPRGRAILLRALLLRQIEPEQTITAFMTCALCGQCQRACPAHLPLSAMFFAMRQILRKYLPTNIAKSLLFRLLATQPKALEFLQPPLSLLEQAYLRLKPAAIPQLPLQPLTVPASEQKPKKRVIFFAGCLTRHFFPNLGKSCLDLLAKCGVDAITLSELACCGRPLAVRGKNLRKVVAHNLAVLADQEFSQILTPCPGCLATIRKIWPQIAELTPDQRQQAVEIAAKIQSVNIFLERNLPEPSMPPESCTKSVWWHNPCLMDPQDTRAALKLLGPGLAASSSPGQCCGAALACCPQVKSPNAPAKSGQNQWGLSKIANARQYTLQEAMTRKIWQQALADGAKNIITGCPGCMLALNHSLAKAGKKLPVRHVLELLAKSRQADGPE